MYKELKSNKKLNCVIYKDISTRVAKYSCTQNAIHSHVADTAQFILMACYSTIIVFVLPA